MLSLSNKYVMLVKEILAKHVSDYEIRVFGSRISGAHKEYSDLDLVIMNDQPLDVQVRTQLRNDFEESVIPIKIDFVEWADLSDSFKKIIEEKNEVL